MSENPADSGWLRKEKKKHLNPISHPELKSSVNSNKVGALMLI